MAGRGEVVWIQDYHLMLLPALLRAHEQEMKIGWFLHTPFPSSGGFWSAFLVRTGCGAASYYRVMLLPVLAGARELERKPGLA